MKTMSMICCGFLLGSAAAAGAEGELKVGAMAPDFELTGSDGEKYRLSQFKGKKPVVIAWYPKAFTGG